MTFGKVMTCEGLNRGITLFRPERKSDSTCCDNDLIVVDGTDGFYEFDFEYPSGNTFILEVTYASKESRPITMKYNNHVFEDKCCEITNGWGMDGLFTEAIGPIVADDVKTHTLTVLTKQSFFPHLYCIVIVPFLDYCAVLLQTPNRKSQSVFCDGGLVMVDGTRGYYEFDFVWTQSPKFKMEIMYASEDSRPVNLQCNSAYMSKVCEEITGGYGIEALAVCGVGPVIADCSGMHTLTVTTDESYFPHIHMIRILPYTNEDNSEQTLCLVRLKPSITSYSPILLDVPTRRSTSTQICDHGLIIVDGTDGWYEFDFISPNLSNFKLEIIYASGESRPVLIQYNGRSLGEACAEVSGGWTSRTLTTVVFGVFAADSDVSTHTLSVTTDNKFFPHIQQIRVIPVSGDQIDVLPTETTPLSESTLNMEAETVLLQETVLTVGGCDDAGDGDWVLLESEDLNGGH